MKNKCIFAWHCTDGYTYGYDVNIPFECDDLDKFILECVDKVKSSKYGCNIFNMFVEKHDIDNLYYSFYTLEDWFTKNKFNLEN